MKSSKTSSRRSASKSQSDSPYLVSMRTALGSVIFFLPLLYYHGFADFWELPKMIVLSLGVSVALISWLLWSWRSGAWQARFDWLSISLGLLALVTILSTIFSVHPYTSIFGMSGTQSDTGLALLYFIIFAFLLRQSTDERCGRMYLALFLSSGTLASLLSLAHLSGIPVLPGQNIPEAFHAVAGSPGMLGLWSGLQLLLAWQLWKNAAQHVPRLLLSLAMTVHLLLLLFTDASLAAWFVLIAAALLILSRIMLRRGPYADVWIALAAAVSIVVLSVSITEYSGKSYGVDITMPASTSLQVSLDAVKDQPILGNGPSSFFYSAVTHRPESMNTSAYADIRFTRPDNFWLQLFSGLGILGGLLLVWILAKTLWQSIGQRWQETRSDYAMLVMWFFLFQIFILFLTPGSMSLMLSLWLSIGLLGALSVTKTASQTATLLKLIPALAVLSLIVLWYGQLRVWLGAGYIVQARTAISRVEPLPKVQSLIDRAIAFDPWRSTYQLDAAEHAFISAQLTAQSESQQQIARSAVPYIEEAIRLDPKNPVMYEQALRYIPALRALTGNSTLLEQDMLTQLTALEPKNSKHLVNWAKLELVASQQLGDDTSAASQRQALLQSAYTHLTKALDLAPGQLDARYHLALTHELLGSETLARDMMRALALDYPNDPDVLFELARHEGLNGDYNEAIRLLQRVLEFTPRSVQVRLALAEAYEKTEQKEEAIAQLEFVLQLDAENETAQKQLNALRDAGGEVQE